MTADPDAAIALGQAMVERSKRQQLWDMIPLWCGIQAADEYARFEHELHRDDPAPLEVEEFDVD